MAQVTKALRQACAEAEKQLTGNAGVVSVGIGFRYKDGKRTDEVCIVVGVKKKLPKAEVPASELVMETVDDVRTDVIEYGELKPHGTGADGIEPQSLTRRRRPAPPGYSIGHPEVTAGTLGAWVHRGPGGEHYILSNNHVMANSNDTSLGVFIRQPGRADGGTDVDRLARLTEFVRIRFDNDGDGGGGKKSSAAMGWSIWRWPANFVAELVGCPYRLVVARPQQVEQPHPNFVDAAVARTIVEENVELEVPNIGELQGIRDLQLGDRVQKTGRTTEFTQGMVETVGATSNVDYGPGKGVASFQDQLIIRADSGEFSQGGDSGSAIVTEDGFLGGLLFAGGSGITIANRISHVIAFLGIRL